MADEGRGEGEGQMGIARAGLILSITSIGFIAPALAALEPVCQLAEGASARQIELSFKIPVGHLANVYRSFREIRRASGIPARLVVCLYPEPNAFAINPSRSGNGVAITTGMIELLSGDVDEIAAVFGHEFGHLIHKHLQKQARVNLESAEGATNQAHYRLDRGDDPDEVVENAIIGILARVRAFSRVAEREADDEGFALARIAGFDAAGARRFSEKMRSVMGGSQGGWLATHPGWDERVESNARLEMNEKFRSIAAAQLSGRLSKSLQETVEQWRAQIPDSGAAAYYRGMQLRLANESRARVSQAFEDSVSYFTDEGFSRAGQSYQSEASAATVALCISLFREDRISESLHCLKRLTTGEEIDLFREVTGWNGFVHAGRRPQIDRGVIYGARSERSVLITNCAHIAQREGLKELKPWKGIREPATSQSNTEAGVMSCSKDLCDCEPIDPATIMHLLK
jgi:Zn-dependent protease with chaperone function